MFHTNAIRTTIAAAGIGLAAIAAAPAASADTVHEMAYITTLDHFGIQYSTEDAAIETGYAICNGFRQGLTVDDVISIGVKATGGYFTETDVAHIAGAASGALCPSVHVTMT